MALSDLNEADMKGLTEMKPGGKMLIHAHSYSLVAAAHWHTHTQIYIWTGKCKYTHLFTRTYTHAHTRGVENSLGKQLLKKMYREKRHDAVACLLEIMRCTFPMYSSADLSYLKL